MDVGDPVMRGLSLLDQLTSVRERLDNVAARRPAAKADERQIGVDCPTARDFAQTVNEVLKAWRFLGPCQVSLTEAAYDPSIDGKLWSRNRREVLAITHAAYKLALLLFRRGRNLPHPGFVVIDSPLPTYRDPIAGERRAAEDDAIAGSSLKQHFFEHPSTVSADGQFIAVENVDPSAGLDDNANDEIIAASAAVAGSVCSDFVRMPARIRAETVGRFRMRREHGLSGQATGSGYHRRRDVAR